MMSTKQGNSARGPARNLTVREHTSRKTRSSRRTHRHETQAECLLPFLCLTVQSSVCTCAIIKYLASLLVARVLLSELGCCAPGTYRGAATPLYRSWLATADATYGLGASMMCCTLLCSQRNG